MDQAIVSCAVVGFTSVSPRIVNPAGIRDAPSINAMVYEKSMLPEQTSFKRIIDIDISLSVIVNAFSGLTQTIRAGSMTKSLVKN